MSIYYRISCDNCRKTNLSSHRYKCLVCSDYDLCFDCYEKQIRHTKDHPMQLIVTSTDFEKIYYGQIRMKSSPPLALTCSYCHQNGFSLELLIKHLDDKHIYSNLTRLCPICFLRDKNLSKHLQTKHLQINEKENPHLLQRFLRQSSIDKSYNQRTYFLQYLLTDLFNREI